MEKIMGGKEMIALVMLMLLGVAMTVSVSVSVAASRATLSSASSSSRRRNGSEKVPAAVGVGVDFPQNRNRSRSHRQRDLNRDNQNDDAGGAEEEKEELQLDDHYYTMYSYQSRANLKIKLDGRIEWDYGSPNLYSRAFCISLFFERLVNQPDSQEQMYVLEATASAYLICMNAKGRFYTIPMAPPPPPTSPPSPSPPPGSQSNKDLLHIRHKEKKRWRVKKRRMSTFPPTDCLFKTYEFTADESFEKAVGIYSYPHSNTTHGRFLSRNPRTGKVRSYRKAFSSLYRHSQTKITQLPVRYLRDMIVKTRFSREDKFNLQVRQCILHLLTCPEQKEKMRQAANSSLALTLDGDRGGGGRRAHLHRIIERCKRRAQETEKLPKCRRKANRASSKFKRKVQKRKM